jgi:hypothetical protein
MERKIKISLCTIYLITKRVIVITSLNLLVLKIVEKSKNNAVLLNVFHFKQLESVEKMKNSKGTIQLTWQMSDSTKIIQRISVEE